MDVALLLARLLLASVFVVAGAAKLADREGPRRAIADFGVPAPLATLLGVLLPLTEVAVAAALIPASSAWWGAAGALVLLLLFVAGIAVNLARGRKPECHCFGQLYSAPAGWKTLARNGLLASVAGFVVWQGSGAAGASAVGWLADLSVAQVVGSIFGLAVLVVLAAQCWLLFNFLRQNGLLMMRVEALERVPGTVGATLSAKGVAVELPAGLPIGALAPEFELAGLHGERHTLESLRAAEKPVMLLFTDPDCGPCTAMFPEIGRWQKEHAVALTISLVSRGIVEANRAKSTERGLRGTLLQQDWEILEAYGVEGAPSAVLVRSNGTIGSPVLEGTDAIRALLEYAVGERSRLPIHPGGQQGELCLISEHAAAQAAPEVPMVGEPSPQIELPDLKGTTVSLKYFRGERVVVLFWDPECGFCREILPALNAWEDDPPKEAPKLLVVSSGRVEANKAMDLHSTVVLDQNFSVGSAFGANGTPIAVLVDSEGRVASEVTVGAPAVLALAGASQADV